MRTEHCDDNKPEELKEKIVMALLYYGLLRSSEVLQLNFNDINLNLTENIEVNFPYLSKRSTRRFSFTIPSWLKPSFLYSYCLIERSIFPY